MHVHQYSCKYTSANKNLIHTDIKDKALQCEYKNLYKCNFRTTNSYMYIHIYIYIYMYIYIYKHLNICMKDRNTSLYIFVGIL